MKKLLLIAILIAGPAAQAKRSETLAPTQIDCGGVSFTDFRVQREIEGHSRGSTELMIQNICKQRTAALFEKIAELDQDSAAR